MRRDPRHLGPFLAAAICASSAILLVALGSKLTFFNDDWYFLLQRPGVGGHALLAPHNGNLVVLAVLVFKALVGVFGLGSQLPFRLAVALEVAALGFVMFLLVRERCGQVLALLATALVVFLGTAWEDLWWSFQIGLIGSLTAGLAVLHALGRDTPRRNALACAGLVVAIALSNAGLPFVLAALVAVALRRRPRQLWIPLVPAALFGLWYATYGNDAPSSITAHNIRHLPHYLFDSASSTLASLTDLRVSLAGATRATHLVVALMVVAAAVWAVRRGRANRGVLVPLAALIGFWALTGAGFTPGREPTASRYQLVDVALLLLVLTELGRGARLGIRAIAAIAALAALGFVANVEQLQSGYRFMRTHGQYAKADLGALQIARARVEPTFQLSAPVAQDPYLSGITASRYFAETAAHGSPPAYSPAQLATAPEGQRQAADHVMLAAYRMLALPYTGTARSCRPLASGGELPSGRASVLRNRGGAAVVVSVRRFAGAQRPVAIGFIGSGAAARLAVPRDSVALPWRLVARGGSPLELCSE